MHQRFRFQVFGGLAVLDWDPPPPRRRGREAAPACSAEEAHDAREGLHPEGEVDRGDEEDKDAHPAVLLPADDVRTSRLCQTGVRSVDIMSLDVVC